MLNWGRFEGKFNLLNSRNDRRAARSKEGWIPGLLSWVRRPVMVRNAAKSPAEQKECYCSNLGCNPSHVANHFRLKPTKTMLNLTHLTLRAIHSKCLLGQESPSQSPPISSGNIYQCTEKHVGCSLDVLILLQMYVNCLQKSVKLIFEPQAVTTPMRLWRHESSRITARHEDIHTNKPRFTDWTQITPLDSRPVKAAADPTTP